MLGAKKIIGIKKHKNYLDYKQNIKPQHEEKKNCLVDFSRFHTTGYAVGFHVGFHDEVCQELGLIGFCRDGGRGDHICWIL